MAESLDPTKPRSCILGFFEAFRAVANALILSSALYLSKISRMFKTDVNVRKKIWGKHREQGFWEQGVRIFFAPSILALYSPKIFASK